MAERVNITEADRDAARGLLPLLYNFEYLYERDVETAAQVIADARAEGAQSQAPDERVVASAYRPVGWGHK